MYSPYSDQIEQVCNDMRIIEDTLSALDDVEGHLNSVSDHLANLGTHISTGFNVECSATSLVEAPSQSLSDSRQTLRSAYGELEGELDSLRRQENDWIAEVEAARKAAEELKNRFGSYSNGYDGRWS
ncbi:hypothetical protein B5F40_15610 [Gordonibacter sp. An230]|uniref:hypothetical protein n=1 Tax=Gordonibacter sp. An230 TaxID=1965592 RepID=UPI000B38BB95|nr:hypothetical protein [Gordonibacter sp. An230]OUO85826.1 hypothetical protein B5F40_15610 [Gordonibacter sp. An230]